MASKAPLDGDVGRGTTIDHIEKAINSRADLKDPKLEIVGLEKTDLGTYGGFKVFRIDREWVKNNLSCMFGTGGHGRVHEFIPNDELWVDDIEEPWWEIALHEAVEFFYMQNKGLTYEEAHAKASEAEVEINRKGELEGLIEKHRKESEADGD